MTTQESSGLLLYRGVGKGTDDQLEVLLGHMGGPYWAKKHEHAWSIPKGLHDDDETDHLAVAEREFAEEMGAPAPGGASIDLGFVRSGKKRITAFARAGDFDADAIVSNTFELEWPPRSGEIQTFPEIDRAAWVALADAEFYLTRGQGPFVARLRAALQREHS